MTTTSTKTQETLRRGAEKVCERCEGVKRICTYVTPGTYIAAEWEPCPACRDASNKPTGYQSPWLRRGCGQIIRGIFISCARLGDSASACKKCQGYGYLLPPEAELAGVLMEMLLNAEPVVDVSIYLGRSSGSYFITINGYDDDIAEGPTLIDALTAAWAKTAGLDRVPGVGEGAA